MGMLLKDGMLGNVEVNEGAIEELIKSNAMKRLKGIAQQGIPKEFLSKSMPAYTRYEHSIGCMILLRHFGASLEEQIAGLLHDVSHYSFSHVVDGMLKNSKITDVHDKRHTEYFHNSQISRILEKYRISPKKVADIRKFTLLEREIPDICVDRLESNLRYYHYMHDKNLIESVLGNLVVHGNELLFRSDKVALRFSSNYLAWQPEGKGWGNKGYELTIKYYYLAGILKDAIKLGIINIDDLKHTDIYVLGKLRRSKNSAIVNALKRLRNLDYKLVKRNGTIIKQKFRYVDPKCMVKGKIKRLSSIVPSYRNALELAREKNREGARLEIR
jgi:uncharacterized protein